MANALAKPKRSKKLTRKNRPTVTVNYRVESEAVGQNRYGFYTKLFKNKEFVETDPNFCDFFEKKRQEAQPSMVLEGRFVSPYSR